MKKLFIFCLLVLMVFSTAAFAQDIRASKIPAAPVVAGTAAETPTYVNLLVLTSELPVSFVRMSQVNGNWKIGGQMSIGASYVVMYGKGTLQADGSVSNYNSFAYLGPVISLDAATDGTSISTGVTVGGVVGVGPMSAIFGYDVAAKQPVLGIGFKIDILTLTDATTTVLQRWNVKQ
jgi:hypothetical protein